MKSHYVNELKPGMTLDSTFQVDEINQKMTKTGKPYWMLTIKDRTGSVTAKVWDADAWVDTPPQRGDYIKVRAETSTYNGKIDVKLAKVRLLVQDRDGDEFDYEDFVPVGPHNRFKLLVTLQEIAEDIQHPGLRAIVSRVCTDPAISTLFRDAPAASKIHQAYIGGLVEHVWKLTQLARGIFTVYELPRISQDLILAACYLHDIGKIRELEWTQGIRYSKEGELIGHVALGMERLIEWRDDYWSAIEREDALPHEGDDWNKAMTRHQDVWLHLRHIVASHHGQLEWKAITVPQSLEANLFHQIDMVESRHGMISNIQATETFDAEGFGPFNHRMGQRVWRMV